MRILVTGATGFLGGVVARELAAAGHDVTGTGRDAGRGRALQESGVNFVPLDLRRADGWAAQVGAVDAVVHAAARSTLWARWADLYAENVEASERIARLCAGRQVPLVHVSSPSVYNATGRRERVPEDTPFGPRFDSPYARSKALAEVAVQRHHPAATLLRPRGLYGPGDPGIVPRVVRALRAGRLPRLKRTEVHTELTHVRNAAHAVHLALRQPVAGPVNISDGETVPIWATIEQIARAIGAPPPRRFVPGALVERVATVLDMAARLRPGAPEPVVTASAVRLLIRPMTLDLTRARRELGYTPPVSPQEGLAEVLAALEAGA
ncbi:nucleoside-diphosphate-sugar epimerase [Deinococcus metalli]|nr:NAD(P)-dependent oxidoreductase [Deinococcus metalli]MBB5375887.1 nucleoside-diphosphate-sugar epimerase [Deinococcus metalli]